MEAARYGDEVLGLVGLCHSGASRGHSQLLGPSNPRLELLMGFKWRPPLCTWSTWHPREVEKGPCATGRFRRHVHDFRHFAVHMNHNEVYICVCEAKLRRRCNIAISRASSWLMRVKAVNAESTRDRYEITRDTRWHRDLYEASQTHKYALLRFRRAIKRRKPPRWSLGAI